MKTWTDVLAARQDALHTPIADWTDNMRAAAGATGVLAIEVVEPIVPGTPAAAPVDFAALVNAAVAEQSGQMVAQLAELLASAGIHVEPAATAEPTPEPPAAPAAAQTDAQAALENLQNQLGHQAP